MELQTAKGVRDVPSPELIFRNSLISRMIDIFERYGFNPLETPMIERLDVLNVKFGAGVDSDVAKEIFRFKDQGERDLGLRFELTLSMCRYVAMNPNLKLPFKRYEIGRVYRDGPIKLGRSREFMQCDVDIVGAKGMAADAECIRLALDVFRALNIDAYIEVNNRKLINGILEYAGVSSDKFSASIIILDKFNKIGESGVAEELEKLGVESSSCEKIFSLLKGMTSINPLKVLEKINKKLSNDASSEGISELRELFSLFSKKELKDIRLNLSLARGLSYYTGTVFEGFARNSEVKSSICGGGRYDDMIRLLMDSKDEFPAVGISFGIVPIMEVVKQSGMTFSQSVVSVYVVPIGNTLVESLSVASSLRKKGIKTDIDLMKRGVSKNLDFANAYGIPFVLFLGENELKDGKLKLRNMANGEESFVSLKNSGVEVSRLVSNFYKKNKQLG